MQYRRDIDGLRALAVLPVLFYHAGMSAFSGGYVGVDIFFVISGFLITSVIIEELKNNKFTIKNFYVRRVKRIFPALFLVLLVTAVLCVFLQMPYDLRKFGKSLSAAVLFGSNIYFKEQTGYFMDAAESKPLLHTWSLSVEEQFYIFYPIILIIISKWLGKHYRRYIVLLFLISLTASMLMINRYPVDTFYLLHPRAWELLSGALIALGLMPEIRHKLLAEVLGIVGIVMIAYSINAYDHDTVFPAYGALLPCAGAFLLIYTGTAQTVVSKVLSARPIVYIGLLSYSLYLWHWPLLSFFNSYRPLMVIDDSQAALVRLSILLLSFVLSVLTYKYIETPFRRMRPENTKIFFRKTFAVMAVVCLLGGVLYWADGFPGRIPESAYRIDKGGKDGDNMGSCKDSDISAFKGLDSIHRLGVEGGEAEFLLMGDSHAGAIAPGFDKYAGETGRSGLLMSRDGLVPILGYGHRFKDCYSYLIGSTIDIVNQNPAVKKVILAGRWVTLVEGKKGATTFSIYDKDHNSVEQKDAEDFFYTNLKKTVESLQSHGKEVYIVYGVPEIDVSVPYIMSKVEFLKVSFGVENVVDMRPTVEGYNAQQSKVHRVLDRLSDETGVTLLHPEDVLRDGDRYDLLYNGYSIYRDDNHLSKHGAKFIVQSLGHQVFGD
jgi:peptidoglycan/LPS O-acetylase OafA/YrhL